MRTWSNPSDPWCRDQVIVAAAAGRGHSLVLSTDGSISTWGDARMGQLGHEVIARFMAANTDQPVSVPLPHMICALDPARLPASSR